MKYYLVLFGDDLAVNVAKTKSKIIVRGESHKKAWVAFSTWWFAATPEEQANVVPDQSTFHPVGLSELVFRVGNGRDAVIAISDLSGVCIL